MIPSRCYGRPLEHWLLYYKLPIFFGTKLFIIQVNEPVIRYIGLSIVPQDLAYFYIWRQHGRFVKV